MKNGSFQDWGSQRRNKNGERIPKEGKEKTEIINDESERHCAAIACMKPSPSYSK